MIHARFDVVILSHRKAFKAGPEAMGLWAFCVIHTRDQETDGFVPEEIAHAAWGGRKNEQLAKRCVEAGLLERVDGGYLVVNYAAKNETKAQIDERRTEERERKAKYRKGGSASETPARPTRKPVGVPEVSHLDTRGTDKGVPAPESEPESESEPDPPVSPPGGNTTAAVRPPRSAGLDAFEASFDPRVDAYCRGISAVTGTRFTLLQTSERTALWKACEHFDFTEALVEAAARDFATRHDPAFGGYAPQTFAKWLRDGRPDRRDRKSGRRDRVVQEAPPLAADDHPAFPEAANG